MMGTLSLKDTLRYRHKVSDTSVPHDHNLRHWASDADLYPPRARRRTGLETKEAAALVLGCKTLLTKQACMRVRS